MLTATSAGLEIPAQKGTSLPQRKLIPVQDLTMTFDQLLIEGLAVYIGGGVGGGRRSIVPFVSN